MRRDIKITIDGKTKDFTIKTREKFAPKQQVVKSKKVYTRKAKHKNQSR